ncbi:MAG TPA: hypothetical protein ENH54_02745, partial [Actinobacteria bacterium]|nr:hypothetical protein [Actinomycetota bacterium]
MRRLRSAVPLRSVHKEYAAGGRCGTETAGESDSQEEDQGCAQKSPACSQGVRLKKWRRLTRFKTIVRYSSYLLGSRLLSRVLFTVFFIYAASLLGPELFGALSFTLVTVELLSSIGDLGITRYAARELVRHWDNKELLAGEVLFLQGLTSVIISLGGLLVILAWQPQYPKLQMLLLAMA